MAKKSCLSRDLTLRNRNVNTSSHDRAANILPVALPDTPLGSHVVISVEMN